MDVEAIAKLYETGNNEFLDDNEEEIEETVEKTTT